jgi:hypothetical protein
MESGAEGFVLEGGDPYPAGATGGLTVSWGSLGEVARFFQAIRRRKHRAMGMAASAAGLRIAGGTNPHIEPLE